MVERLGMEAPDFGVVLKEGVGAEDIEGLEKRLRDVYRGMWVAVLDSGEIVADKRLEEVVDRGGNRIVTLFKIPEKGVVMLR